MSFILSIISMGLKEYVVKFVINFNFGFSCFHLFLLLFCYIGIFGNLALGNFFFKENCCVFVSLLSCLSSLFPSFKDTAK